MKKLLALTILFCVASLPVLADIIYPDGYKPTQNAEPAYLKKLARGWNNILTSPIEVPKSALDMSYEYGSWNFEAWTYGLIVRGPFLMWRRLSAGIIDAATFNNDSVPAKRFHLNPEYLDVLDVVPGGHQQFQWETIDTPAFRLDNPPMRW
jgi:hypothetical protein